MTTPAARPGRDDRYLRDEARMGEHLRRLREERGWSHKDMAQRLTEANWPVHQASVSKLEAARRPLRVADLQAYAKALGITAKSLILAVPPEDETPAERELRERLQAIHQAREALGQHLRKLGGDYAMALTEEQRLRHALSALDPEPARQEP